jgi:hypothetical protein
LSSHDLSFLSSFFWLDHPAMHFGHPALRDGNATTFAVLVRKVVASAAKNHEVARFWDRVG